MICPKCKKEIKDNSIFCEYCGYKCNKTDENISLPIIGLICLLCIMLPISICLTNINSEKASKNSSEIEKITKEQEPVKEEFPVQKNNTSSNTTPSLNKITVISKGFGYTQYGEAGVVGKIKNNNSQALYIRADIDLLDSYGNVIGDTYTYQQVEPNSIWNFEAPTFGINASDFNIHLSID